MLDPQPGIAVINCGSHYKVMFCCWRHLASVLRFLFLVIVDFSNLASSTEVKEAQYDGCVVCVYLVFCYFFHPEFSSCNIPGNQ